MRSSHSWLPGLQAWLLKGPVPLQPALMALTGVLCKEGWIEQRERERGIGEAKKKVDTSSWKTAVQIVSTLLYPGSRKHWIP